jgi:hypothetical protein
MSDIAAAVAAYRQHGSKAAAARALGIPVTTLKDRLSASERPSLAVKGRKELDFTDGQIVVFSDAHYWPGEPSTAHRALIHFCKKLKPDVVVANGDMIDGSSISRHPPIGWEDFPSMKEEFDVCRERLSEIISASPNALHYWNLGNHDARFATRLAQVASEFKGIHGTELRDHFPDWTPSWSLFVGGEKGAVIKHRFKGGQNAPFNNALWAGRSCVTGHLHSAKVVGVTDYSGTRWGVDTGCLQDPYADVFGYQEDNPRNHISGFCVLTWNDSRLLMPELVLVVEPGLVQFRGELIRV